MATSFFLQMYSVFTVTYRLEQSLICFFAIKLHNASKHIGAFGGIMHFILTYFVPLRNC